MRFLIPASIACILATFFPKGMRDVKSIIILYLHVNIIGNWEALHSATRLENTHDKLGDVWDGSVLRPMCHPGRYLSNEHNLTFALSTDGVALYKSSPMSIWPVYLVVF